MLTLDYARRLGAGAILRSQTGDRYRISDWTPSTGHTFGHPILRDGQPGKYQELPAVGLKPEA